MTETQFGLPKKKLVELILKNVSKHTIWEELRIDPNTPLHRRLMGFTKSQLARFFLEYATDAQKALRELAESYPIKQAPTLFLVWINRRLDILALTDRISELRVAGREAEMRFGDDKPIRAVYMNALARPVLAQPLVYEFGFAYERRIVYTSADPGPYYGRTRVVHSLENALFWLPESGTPHAVLACPHFQAVAPIQDFAQASLDLDFICPYLSLATLKLIAATGKPRTASYRAHTGGSGSRFDVRTLTISDPSLVTRKVFSAAETDPHRAQSAGFWVEHPDLREAGVGLSRRYARIWTPAILDRQRLLELSTGIIRKVDREVSEARDKDLERYISRFRNMPVKIGRTRLTGKPRAVFERLVQAAWEAERAGVAQEHPVTDLMEDLLRNAPLLRLAFQVEMDCDNCGDVLAYCPRCHTPQEPIQGAGHEVLLRCTRGCRSHQRAPEKLHCFCGFESDVVDRTLQANLFAHPREPLLRAIHRFSIAAKIPSEKAPFDRLFVLSGGLIRLLSDAERPIFRPLELGDLESWSKVPGVGREGGRLKMSSTRLRVIRGLLNRTKEKCRREGTPPNKEKCAACLDEQQTRQRFGRGELCLGRLFGLPIGRGFDGIHHGHEKADIMYEDRVEGAPRPAGVAIHLKSRVNPRKRGLGRSVKAVKELYTQLFFLAYQVTTGQVDAQVLGVSIPNDFSKGVKSSMLYLSGRLGLKLIFVEERDWLSISNAAWEAMPKPPAKNKKAAKKGKKTGKKVAA